jgi:Transposase DDE domain group 1
MRMLALTGTDARVWEPKRLRLRLFSIAGRIARRSRRTWLHLSAHAPFGHLITTGLARRPFKLLAVQQRRTAMDREAGHR